MLVLGTGCLAPVKNSGVQVNRLASFKHTDNIENSIEILKKAIESDEDEFSRKESYLRLAVLYSHGENSSPQYKKAYSLLQKYSEIVIDGDEKEMVRYFQRLLGVIINEKEKIKDASYEKSRLEDEISQMIQKAEYCEAVNEKINADYQALLEDNKATKTDMHKMKEKLSQLRSLDIRLEKKRWGQKAGVLQND